MVHFPAAVCAIYPVWRLHALYPALSKLVHCVFTYDCYHYVRRVSVHLRGYYDSVSFASPRVSRVPGGTLHGQADESCVFKPGNRSTI